MKPTTMVMLLFFAWCASLSADSLWAPSFKGYVTDKNSIQVGDTVLVSINTKTSLAYLSSKVDSNTLTLNLSGGQAGGLLDFLPTGSTGGNESLSGKEEVSLDTQFAVQVTSIDPNGMLTLSGSRSVTVQGRLESVSFSGVVDRADLGSDRSVDLSRVANVQIVYRTMLQSQGQTITAQDLTTTGTTPAAGATTTGQAGAAASGQTGTTPATGTAPTGAAGQAAAGAQPTGTTPTQTGGAGQGAAATQSSTLKLTDQKKRELLLLYINQLIDLLAQH